ncbi:MAG: hypothetical protein WCB59_05525, partial [Candidatus Sulfotelmatobacter sp.]
AGSAPVIAAIAKAKPDATTTAAAKEKPAKTLKPGKPSKKPAKKAPPKKAAKKLPPKNKKGKKR